MTPQIPITSLPLAQPPPRFDTPPPITQPLPATWTSATDLVVKNNREPRQSLQCQDIKLCISNAVNRATANLFFVNGFPDLKTKNLWLGNSLAHELNNRSKTNLFLREVNARAQQDGTYFGQLFSMVRRFCAPHNTLVDFFHSSKVGGALLVKMSPR